MIEVSSQWHDAQQRMLAPEGFVEISYLLSPDGLQEDATASSSDAADFAGTEKVVDPTLAVQRYATNELNLWALDGTMDILPDSGPYTDTGYVSSNFGSGSVTVSTSKTRPEIIPGITITWSKAYGEYATDFTVTAKRGTTQVAKQTVTGNTSATSVVEMNIASFDTVEVSVLGWSIPDRRPRIEGIELGYMVTFGKRDLLSFSHTQTVSLCSGELPKNSISFSLENSSGRWNPNNADGVARYLSDRQRMTVRYGFDVNGNKEWIDAGTFYLSEWRTPANGMEASFEARDLLEYMIDEVYTGPTSGTLYEIAQASIGQIEFPYGTSFVLDDALKNYSADFTEGNQSKTVAEVLQLCANAACCVMYQDRNGVFRIVRESRNPAGYTIKQMVEYSYPEFTLSKPLRAVTVTGAGDLSATFAVSSSGETQTAENTLIGTDAQAAEVAEWIAGTLETRKTVSGEYRADPVLDALDNIGLETKLGTVKSLLITEITYSFGGAFRGSFKGYIPRSDNVTDWYSGELYCGEVV